MYDEKDGGKQQIDAQEPAGGHDLFAEHHHRRNVNGKQQQRIDEKARQSHEKCRDRQPDLPKDVRSRDRNEKNDRTE